jgi:hypothetical protein
MGIGGKMHYSKSITRFNDFFFLCSKSKIFKNSKKRQKIVLAKKKYSTLILNDELKLASFIDFLEPSVNSCTNALLIFGIE